MSTNKVVRPRTRHGLCPDFCGNSAAFFGPPSPPDHPPLKFGGRYAPALAAAVVTFRKSSKKRTILPPLSTVSLPIRSLSSVVRPPITRRTVRFPFGRFPSSGSCSSARVPPPTQPTGPLAPRPRPSKSGKPVKKKERHQPRCPNVFVKR